MIGLEEKVKIVTGRNSDNSSNSSEYLGMVSLIAVYSTMYSKKPFWVPEACHKICNFNFGHCTKFTAQQLF